MNILRRFFRSKEQRLKHEDASGIHMMHRIAESFHLLKPVQKSVEQVLGKLEALPEFSNLIGNEHSVSAHGVHAGDFLKERDGTIRVSLSLTPSSEEGSSPSPYSYEISLITVSGGSPETRSYECTVSIIQSDEDSDETVSVQEGTMEFSTDNTAAVSGFVESELSRFIGLRITPAY